MRWRACGTVRARVRSILVKTLPPEVSPETFIPGMKTKRLRGKTGVSFLGIGLPPVPGTMEIILRLIAVVFGVENWPWRELTRGWLKPIVWHVQVVKEPLHRPWLRSLLLKHALSALKILPIAGPSNLFYGLTIFVLISQVLKSNLINQAYAELP